MFHLGDLACDCCGLPNKNRKTCGKSQDHPCQNGLCGTRGEEVVADVSTSRKAEQGRKSKGIWLNSSTAHKHAPAAEPQLTPTTTTATSSDGKANAHRQQQEQEVAPPISSTLNRRKLPAFMLPGSSKTGKSAGTKSRSLTESAAGGRRATAASTAVDPRSTVQSAGRRKKKAGQVKMTKKEGGSGQRLKPPPAAANHTGAAEGLISGGARKATDSRDVDDAEDPESLDLLACSQDVIPQVPAAAEAAVATAKIAVSQPTTSSAIAGGGGARKKGAGTTVVVPLVLLVGPSYSGKEILAEELYRGYTVMDASLFFRRHGSGGSTGGLRQFMFAIQHAVMQQANVASNTETKHDPNGVVVIHNKMVHPDHRSAYKIHFERDNAPAVKIICVEVSEKVQV